VLKNFASYLFPSKYIVGLATPLAHLCSTGRAKPTGNGIWIFFPIRWICFRLYFTADNDKEYEEQIKGGRITQVCAAGLFPHQTFFYCRQDMSES
jgi:hypothetical protein